MKNNKAAMEMSVGTIVTIVLLMSVLVLGLVLTKDIFKSAKGAIDLTDSQLQSELGKLFGSEDVRVAIYPSSNKLTIKVGNADAFGVGIKNIATSLDSSTSFTYDVESNGNTCGLSPSQAESLIVLGKSDNMEIPLGALQSGKITFQIREGVPECLLRYKVNVQRQGLNGNYDSQIVEVEIKA